MVTHKGGCHCGRVRFEVKAPAELNLSECNCSVCAKSGYLGMTVPKERFRLLQGEDSLTTYTFNTGVARHLFCSHCGIKSFYVPRSHPDGINVNARCLDPGTIAQTTVRPFNGQEWEQQFPKGRAESFPN
ncbi:MAG: GFA family protein [Alphaproteobacteria bacterium]|jgi:hypothetical protein|nr:GFA family protein [Alphaproteobacteria bacterium]